MTALLKEQPQLLKRQLPNQQPPLSKRQPLSVQQPLSFQQPHARALEAPSEGFYEQVVKRPKDFRPW